LGQPDFIPRAAETLQSRDLDKDPQLTQRHIHPSTSYISGFDAHSIVSFDGSPSATIRCNAAIERKRTLGGPDCTRLVIVPICEMDFLDSHTPLASARAGLLPRGFKGVAGEMARFLHKGMHWVGAGCR
jgi:hypothetical protein